MAGKILFLCFLAGAFLTNASAKEKLPPEKALKALTLESLLAFNQAVAAKDFTGFHAQVAQLWQEQVTPPQLADIFKTFIEQQIDLAFIARAEPIFDQPPALNDEGVLTLEGHYATTPNKVEFRLKYIYEKPAWKLFGIKVNVTPAGARDVTLPSEKEIRALVLDSLGNFNQAVQKKDFTAFHEQISALWQKQTTAAKLQSLFQSFIEQKIDLAPALPSTAVFDERPAIDEDGILRLKGMLPFQLDKMHFELAYIFEPPAWKLVKINIQLSGPGEEKKSD